MTQSASDAPIAAPHQAGGGPERPLAKASSRRAPPQAPRGDLLMRQALEQAGTAPALIDRTAHICAVGGEYLHPHPRALRLDLGPVRRLIDTPMSRQSWHHQPFALHAIAPDIQNRRVCARKRQRRANRPSARNRRYGSTVDRCSDLA